MRQVHLGQTERGSYVVTLLTPVVPSPMGQAAAFDSAADDAPFGRQVTRRLIEALAATREATERTFAGDAEAFSETVERGASANLCNAVATLIEPFGGIDIGLTWALAHPAETTMQTVRFGASEAPILREAARRFRERKARPDMPLVGRIQHLKRDDREAGGTATLRTCIDGRTVSVAAVLDQSNYDRAIQAHKGNARVVMNGDPERFGHRWRLRDPYIVDVISDEDDEDGDIQTQDS